MKQWFSRRFDGRCLARAWGLLSTPLSKPGNLITPLSGYFPVFKKRSLSLSDNNSPRCA
ncbi:hypothetical protein [Paenibacillus sp. LPE1-1-1.1]|uniref:hypothetical protein n=1 Tax=Paenibacillus sp. LPE1-1-1.1 TaxID=3135230 RepID=UPI003414A670